MDYTLITQLEEQIGTLSHTLQQLRAENNALRDQQILLTNKQQQLASINQNAADKLKNILQRIRSLES